MPAKSAKQFKFMAAVAHGMKPHEGDPSKKVAKEFVDATPESRRKKFRKALTKKS